MPYSDKVLDHYNNPRNVGSFDRNNYDVGTGVVGAPACGDVMKLQIKVVDNVIVDACFKTFGCGSAIASSSLATEWLKGKTTGEALKIKNVDIATELSLPPVKIHCSILTEEGIKAALKDYYKKQLTHCHYVIMFTKPTEADIDKVKAKSLVIFYYDKVEDHGSIYFCIDQYMENSLTDKQQQIIKQLVSNHAPSDDNLPNRVVISTADDRKMIDKVIISQSGVYQTH